MKIAIDEIKSALQRENIHFVCDEPMKNHTSFRIGGNADILAEPKSEQEVLYLTETFKRYSYPFYVIGNGSNLLVSDKGYRGAVIKLGRKYSDIKINENKITAGAGALLSAISKKAAEASLSGLETVSGVPASFGGAIYMNAGAYGGEMCDVTASVRYLAVDGSIKTATGSELGFGYRKSVFSENGGIVLSGELELKPADKEEILSQMASLSVKRREKQPLEYPSCGSAFKRPEGHFAAALIEQAGLKGYTVGGAQVSEKHSGFVINIGGATAEDVYKLTEHIKEEVFKKFGVELEREMKMLGFD